VSLGRAPSTYELPPRIHLDLYANNQADADYVIMADPEGKRFCVVQA